MTSPTTDRRLGLAGNAAIKAPVTVVAAAAITLSGQQTIDGVAVLASNAAGVPDRVLVTAQPAGSANGIYDVGTGAWTRSIDANGNYDLAQGTMVSVARGTTYARTYWNLTTAAPITIDTTAQTWAISQTLTSTSAFMATVLPAATAAAARALLSTGGTPGSAYPLSGTSVDITVPASLDCFKLVVVGASTDGVSPLGIRLGDSGGVASTGYSSGVVGLPGLAIASSTFTIMLQDVAIAASTYTYTIGFQRTTGNEWIVSFEGRTGTTMFLGKGSRTMSNVLTTIRLKAFNGTDSFDAGNAYLVV
jgi:hypothetical protein